MDYATIYSDEVRSEAAIRKLIEDELLALAIDPSHNYSPTKYLSLASEFDTIQGEGPFAGLPAYFIRTAGCNRGNKKAGLPNCTFCDADFRHQRIKHYIRVAQDIIDRADTPLVVLTGGEPLLQRYALAEVILRVLRNTKNRPLTFQFETNGDFALDLFAQALYDVTEKYGLPDGVRLKNLIEDAKNVAFVISPKLDKSGEYNVKALMNTLTKSSQEWDEHSLWHSISLKFLFEAGTNEPAAKTEYTGDKIWEAIKVIEDSCEQMAIPIYVSPIASYNHAPISGPASVWTSIEEEGEIMQGGHINIKKTAKNYAAATEFVMKHRNLRLSMQTHLFMDQP